MKPPPSIRFVGDGTPPRAPFGLAWSEGGAALVVQVAGDDAHGAIPDGTTLPAGAWVFVLPEAARSRGLLAAFGKRTVSRSARCGALLLRGYVDIGAEIEPKSRLDLVFGRVP